MLLIWHFFVRLSPLACPDNQCHMTIYDLKPKFQQCLRPLTAFLHRLGITANIVTIAAAVASLAYGAWMAFDSRSHFSFLLLPVFMLVRMASNAVDGMLARECGQQTKMGAILNETGDVVSDAALYAPFSLLSGAHGSVVAMVTFLSVLSEFVGILGQVIGGGRRYDGPLGKSDRAFLFGALGLLIGLGVPVLPYLDAVFIVASVLLVRTTWNRAREALRVA